MLKSGMILREGLRLYRILTVGPEVVEYLDCYPDAAIRRMSSRIVFELGLELGALTVVKPKKGGCL